VPGRSARLYEIRPDAGLVLGLDIGHEYVRGAIADLSGEIRARQSVRAHATSVRGRVAELVGLADLLCEQRERDAPGDHPDGDRQPGRVRPAAQRDEAAPAGCAAGTARRRWPGCGRRSARRW
jgi:hypothetical protein